MKNTHPQDKRYKIDLTKKVFVYKNLHKDCWSVKQNGLVKAHTDHLHLKECQFIVNEKGRERVLKEKRKNVHAGITGYIHSSSNISFDNNQIISYNPYKYNSFVMANKNNTPIYEAGEVFLDSKKVFFVC